MYKYSPGSYTKGEVKQDIMFDMGLGVNTYGSPFFNGASEPRDSRNLCSDLYPALSVRKDKDRISTRPGIIGSVGSRNNKEIHAVFSDPYNYIVQMDTIDFMFGIDTFMLGTKQYSIISHYKNDAYRLTLGISGEDGEGWTEVDLETSATLLFELPKIHVISTTIHYTYLRTGSVVARAQVWTATSSLTGTSFTTTEQTSNAYYKNGLNFIYSTGVFYYVWAERTSDYQISTAKMNENGTGWTTQITTSTSPYKYYPQLATDDTKVYYSWGESDGTYVQLFTGEQTVGFTGWAQAKRTTSNYNKYVYDMDISGTQLYYAIQFYYPGEKYQLMHCTMDTGGVTFVETILTTENYQESTYLTLQTVIYNSKMYYVYYASGSSMIIGNSNLDGTGYSDLVVGPNVNLPYDDVRISILSDILFLLYTSDTSEDFYTITTTNIALEPNWKRWQTGSGWATIKTGLSFGYGQIKDFSTGDIDYSILMNGKDRFLWDGTTVTEMTEAPYSNKFTVHDNRVWAAFGKRIYFSALNKPLDWTTPLDAGSLVIAAAKGNITGIISYDGKVIAFTEENMYIVFGSNYFEYTLDQVEGGVGCKANNSLAPIKGVLTWTWHDGIYKYEQGSVSKMSGKLDAYHEYLNDYNSMFTFATEHQNKLYISMPYVDDDGYSNKNNITFLFDPDYNAFYPDSDGYKFMLSVGNKLYAFNNSSEMWLLEDDGELGKDEGTLISWSWISPPYTKGAFDQINGLADIWLIYFLNSTSTLNIYISKDMEGDDDWNLIKTTTGSKDNVMERFQLPTSLTSARDFYRFKFTGSGYCVIYASQDGVRIG
jgi:hypothetical protein